MSNIDNKKATKKQEPIMQIMAPEFLDISDIEYFKDKLEEAVRLKHNPEQCTICNGLNNGYRHSRLSKMEFEWHMESQAASNGQRLNREALDDMFLST